jgi:ATP dependent DNA ligase C terminal region
MEPINALSVGELRVGIGSTNCLMAIGHRHSKLIKRCGLSLVSRNRTVSTTIPTRSTAHRATQAACQPLKESSGQYPVFRELQGAGDEVLRVARQFGLEGLIARRRDSRYESGRPSRSWVKVKLTHEQEFVVGCRRIHVARWRPRKFRALLVGYNVPAGRLLYAGRVGSGFSEKVLAELYGGLQTIGRATCPFVNLPEKSPGRWGLGLRLGCTLSQ